MNILLKLYPRLNLGDDLFLKIICERYPNINFYLIAPDEYHAINKWQNLHILNNKINKSWVNKVKRFLFKKINFKLYQKQLQAIYFDQLKDEFNKIDGFVSIGGSIFMERYPNIYFDPEIAYYNLINKELVDKPKFFIGCNFGPYYTKDYLDEYKNIFFHAKDVCFREEFSLNLFNSVLDNVRLAPDVVFGMDVKINEKNSKSVGFSIITTRDNIDENLYVSKYIELIKSYLEDEFEVFLFSFCKEEGDEDIIEKISSGLPSNKLVQKIYYKGNIDEFLNIYSKVSLMYCGRFHAMILSMMFEQQIFPITYSNKMLNVLKDISYEGSTIDLQNFYQINIHDTKKNIALNYYNINQIKFQAEDQFKMLDLLLQR